MKTGIVNISSVPQTGYRIDPSLHLSEGVKCRTILSNSPYELITVDKCSSRIFLGNIFSRCFVRSKDFGVTYLSASDTVLADVETRRYISKKQAKKLSYLMLEKDWILVTCSGTLGNVTFTNRCFENKIATHDLIRVVPSDINLRKGCLYAFLTSKFGYYQITQSQFGGVVKHINDKQLGNILVPKFPDYLQNETDILIKESASLREEANNELYSALSQLSQYIQSRECSSRFKTSIVNVKDIKHSLQQRLDPPALMNDGVEAMSEVISRMPYKLIGELDFVVRRPGIFKRVYVDNGIPYIKGSEIFLVNPFRRCERLSRTRTPFIDEMKLKEGQILVTCAGSCGNIKMITKEYEDKESIGSQDIIRIDSDNVDGNTLINKEYLFTYLQLPFVNSYIQSMKYGSVIERIEPFHIESIPVVVPSQELSNIIKSHIKKYMDNTYKAFIAEDRAISMVEQEIEKWNN